MCFYFSEERQAVDTKSKTAEKTKLQRETDDDCGMYCSGLNCMLTLQ